MELLIRKYSESDMIPLWRLLAAQTHTVFSAYPRQTLQDCRSLLHRQSLCLVAQAEGRAAGVLLLRAVGEGGWQRFAAAELAVAEPWQKQGIGKALMTEAKRQAAALRFAGILTAPMPPEEAAFAFFSAEGFVPVGMLPGVPQQMLFWECPKRGKKTRRCGKNRPGDPSGAGQSQGGSRVLHSKA